MSKESKVLKAPLGELILRTQAFPADANPDGDVFGGWVVSQMDIAGGVLSKKRCRGRTVTVAIDSMHFIKPVFVGDVTCCYGEIIREGSKSVAVKLELWSIRPYESERVKVTEGIFTYVALDKDGKPREINDFSEDFTKK